MTSHRSAAASVRRMKDTNPQFYCQHPGCLWRVYIASTDSYKPCPKHPSKETRP